MPAAGGRDWSLGPQLRLRRLVLTERTTDIVQKTVIAATVLENILWIEPLGGLRDSLHFGWARRTVTDGTFDAIDLLKRTTTLGLTSKTATITAPTPTDVRARLAAVLGNPSIPAGAATFRRCSPTCTVS